MQSAQPYMEQPHTSASGPQSSMSHYSGYGQPQALQPAAHSYAPSYPQYSYNQTMAPMSGGQQATSGMGHQMVPQALPLPTMTSNAPQPPPSAGGQQYQQAFDQTGQIAPHGMKPRVTATLWEDEGSLCFQVEANGVCVARREDNHMINGTKLLNVAGMTRGRRDGILKSEKTRHVVKIGPMHLKGVWIPFDRALDFANKEKITEMLYPLFVHNIGALLYHPTNQARQSIGNAAMAARRPDSGQEYMRTPQGTSYEYSGHNAPAPAMHPGQQPLQIDTGMNARTVPTTPASTPPNNTQGIQYQTSQPYDSRQMYSAPSTYAGYAQPPSRGYSGVQASPGGPVKHEMGPPARAGAENEHPDGKAHDGYGGHQDAEGEHEGEYTHTRPLHSDPSHVSPEMTHSPHQNGSGRATPRTANPYPGYTTPQRGAQLPSSNLAYVMSNDARGGAPNGQETYAPQPGYQQQQQYPSMNGAPPSNKRMREVDDEQDQFGRPLSAGADGYKKQRTDPASRPISQPVKAGGMRR